ncbi:MAG: NADH-quinone oxidoreductase, chain, partial [Actinomycetia bacterium]|nr:NADH-quinone oxidoreductase, chain [Actinomycetes bacterium]
GECPLQDQTLAFGPGETRMVEEKRHWEKPIALSPLVLLDRERCIQCARCTRFADEIAGDPLIDFVNRGDAIEVNTFPDEPFASYFSGNTVQICPVGALTSASYRFKARPWDLDQVESTCTSCAVGCRMAVQSSRDEITRYIGIDSDPVNQGWLCDKGRYDYAAIGSEARLTSPKVRKAGELVDVSWAEALQVVADGLAKARDDRGPGGIGVIGGARLPNEDAYAWAKLAKGVLGTDNVDCQLGDGLAPDVVLGLPRATVDDACSASAVILLAPDLKEELPVLYLRLRAAAVERGLPVIELTPQRSGFSTYAKASLQYRPGEAADVAAALLGPNEPTRDVGSVPSAALASARRLLQGEGGERVVVVLGRPSLAEAPELVAEAAGVFSTMPGVTFLSALRRANVHGALDMGLAPGVLPGRVDLHDGRQWFEQEWGVIPETLGVGTFGMLSAAATGHMPALVLLGADPLRDFPDRQLARKGLEGAAFVVAIDCFETASVAHANVVLPAATFAERGGTTTNLEGRITRLGQKITAPGVAWPDWMIAAELAFRLGSDLGFDGLDSIWDEIERVAPSHAGITRAVLGSRAARDGIVAPLRATSISISKAGPAPIDPVADPGIEHVESQGPAPEVEPVPADASAADAPAPGLPRPALVQFDPESLAAHHPLPDAYSLRLVASRKLYDEGTLVQHSPHLAPLAPALDLRVNPFDLEPLGLAGGGAVRLHSARSSLMLEAIPDPGVPRGAAWLVFNVSTGPDTDGSATGAADLIDASSPVTDVRLETR